MTPWGSNRIEDIFEAARALAADDRPEFLEHACGSDIALRHEIESLLASHDSADAFLETPALGLLPGLAQVSLDHRTLIGRTIGAYRLVRVLGAGGMGRVFESQQDAPRRPVALKLMHAALASPAAKRRFQYEAEILARLDHPGIARIYEAGVHEEPTGSIPFFAMEYVPGGRGILDHAREHRLALRARLALFAEVCDAAHHGHQKGVIHRDLKPGNILVNPRDGKPKIIDFGVARVTHADAHLSAALTRAGELVGTLPYMSPEQCTDDPDGIDIRSDIYTLGVVLFELLTGARPYETARRPLPEVARIIREQSPKRPSLIDRNLRGDIETIVLKALEKDRERRYASAADFAQDLRRYLAGEPIEAHPPNAIYQFRKLVGRHRLPALLIALLFTAVTALAITATMMSAELAAERDRAEAEAQTTQRIADFQKDLLIAAAPRVAQGRDVTVREVLDEAARHIGENLGDEPGAAATMHDTIGQAYYGLGKYTEAEAQYLAALELRRDLHGDDHPRVLNTMNNLALLYVDMGRYADAQPLYDAVLTGQRAQLGDDHRDTLISTLNYAALLESMGRRPEAIVLVEDIAELCRTTLASDDAIRLSAINSLAVFHAKEGDLASASPLFEETFTLSQAKNGPDHPATLAAMNNLARLYARTDRRAEGESLMREVIDRRTRVLGANHPATLGSRSYLAGMLRDAGEFPAAETILSEILDLRRRKLGEGHPDTLMSQREYGDILRDLGDEATAETHYRAALDGFRHSLPPGHDRTTTTLLALGECLNAQAAPAAAEPYLLESLEHLRDSRGIADRHSQRAVHALIAVYEALREDARAAELRALLIPTDPS